jgi:uncharacterized protein YceH (UPF0502 family)
MTDREDQIRQLVAELETHVAEVETRVAALKALLADGQTPQEQQDNP